MPIFHPAWLRCPPSDISGLANETGLPMNYLATHTPLRKLPSFIVATALSLASPAFAAEDPADAPKGAAVTVLKAAKSCFSAIVEVSGTVLAREETMVRPERQGLKIAEIMEAAREYFTVRQIMRR